MDFFDRQDQARRNTKLLVVYFVTGVSLLIVAVYLAAFLVFSVGSYHRHRSWDYYSRPQPMAELWNPQLFAGVALGTLAVVAFGALFKTAELARGGGAVANLLGGRLVNPNTTDPDERKLLNVVEEMAIAAGLPVPQVYLLPEESGINAFAAGHSASDAVVAVTEGCLRLLSREELQGVIGHEFSHILNGDMRINLRLIGIIFGIVCLAVIGRILLQTRGRRNPLPIFGLALVVIGWVGVLFGRLIQAAICRQREFLADASAVQFTRNPAGLAGALKKIGGLGYGSRLESPHAAEASHLFFSNGMGASLFHLFDTHPPLVQRIRALEPDFDGRFPHTLPAALVRDEPVKPAPPKRQAAAFPSPGPLKVPPHVIAHTILADAGNPTPVHLRYAEELRDAIPANLQAAARDPLGASALIYALLLSDDETTRNLQIKELTAASDAICRETLRVWPDVRTVATHAKLPLLDLTLPALRNLSPAQYKQFVATVRTLVESDGEVDLFEYVLQKAVLRHLAPHFSPAPRQVIQFYALRPLVPDCAVLLSALAHLGQDAPEQIEVAFAQGAQLLSRAAQTELLLVPADQCELVQVDAALNRLAQAAPQIKKNVIQACAQTVAADGLIREMEAELLRAIADMLDCPLPPFIPAREPVSAASGLVSS